MRIHTEGVSRGDDAFTFDFEGRPVQAYPGENLAAALVSAGEWQWRNTREGEARSLFCGMGVCGECTVSVDGVARRACLEKARPGLQVGRQPGWRALGPATAPVPERQWESRNTDVLVVGAGPAGVAAATTAARAGARVLVVDERAMAGGQYFKQPGSGFALRETQLDAQFREGRQRRAEAEAAGVEFLFNATVWGAFSAGEVGVVTEEGCLMLHPRRLILSPGAYERPLPFPGWTLPGVMTTGAAQTLLRAYQTAPGQRVLVAGNGPLNLQVASELCRAGVTVVAVAELAPRPGIARAAAALRLAANGPGLVLDGLRHLATLARHRVPLLYGHALCRATGEARVDSATLVPVQDDGTPRPGSEREFAVDAVCMGYGFQPQSELARALECAHDVDPQTGQLRIRREADGRSSVPEVFVPGDAGGLGGARVAIAQGTLAGAAAAVDLGFSPASETAAGVRAAQRLAARHGRFQRALWQVYAAPDSGLSLSSGNTIICRCESVTRDSLAACFARQVGDIGAVKRETRAGMGRCQGRYCGALLVRMAAEAGFAVRDDNDLFAPRTPFKPVPIGLLATGYDASRPPDRERPPVGTGERPAPA
jgi:NADPH-dependent 2,4-dienoyl-CoA reductase/sulfur reductase-like enzyme